MLHKYFNVKEEDLWLPLLLHFGRSFFNVYVVIIKYPNCPHFTLSILFFLYCFAGSAALLLAYKKMLLDENQKFPYNVKFPISFYPKKYQRHQNVKESKPYTCQCGRSYAVLATLARHKKWECGKEPSFTCRFCSLKTKQKSNLIVHIKKMHSEELKLGNWNALQRRSSSSSS